VSHFSFILLISFFIHRSSSSSSIFFFLNDPPTTEIYTLSLHDALPISRQHRQRCGDHGARLLGGLARARTQGDREHGAGGVRNRSEEPRLNSSHVSISYAVFCLKKKKKKKKK